MEPPTLGVGLTYFSGVEPVLEAHGDLVDVLEIEPQTLWYHTGSAERPYRLDRDAVGRVASFGCAKLLHGIGFPVGGARRPDPRQIPLLADMVASLAPPWMSEHLSFNRAGAPAGEFPTGFLLPPRQTAAGVGEAVRSIHAMASALPVPLAVETGVNYLRPRRDEMPDGEFVAAVVGAADCGLLLDLHNLWTNERNGRQSVREFLDQIPLDRVWEVHLAGGDEHAGYWVDSHSGAVPAPLLDLAEAVLPRLPNVRALVFELFPAYLDRVGLDLVRAQLVALRGAWDRRGRRARPGRRPSAGPAPATPRPEHDGPAPAEWEDVLGALVTGRAVEGELARQLAADPGLAVVQDLLAEFRASMIVGTLKLTSRLIMLSEGVDHFRRLLRGFWRDAPPALFASQEAEGFATFLEAVRPPIAHLADVLTFERAVLATLLDGRTRVVEFHCDPLPLLRALGGGRVPGDCAPGRFEVEVTPDDAGADQGALRALQLLH